MAASQLDAEFRSATPRPISITRSISWPSSVQTLLAGPQAAPNSGPNPARPSHLPCNAQRNPRGRPVANTPTHATPHPPRTTPTHPPLAARRELQPAEPASLEQPLATGGHHCVGGAPHAHPLHPAARSHVQVGRPGWCSGCLEAPGLRLGGKLSWVAAEACSLARSLACSLAHSLVCGLRGCAAGSGCKSAGGCRECQPAPACLIARS